MQVLGKLYLGLHFICAEGEGVECPGGGNRRRLREVYIIQASAGVSLATNGDVVPAQLDVAFVEDSSEITLEELDY